jgi:hypothetical protein
VLLSVMLGMRESHEDWLALGRDLIARGLGAPMLIMADSAPGLIKAVEQCWPASDRQHCCVHRVRNLLAKLARPRTQACPPAYWQALDDATGERGGKQRLTAPGRRTRSGRLHRRRQVSRRRPGRARRAPALPDPTPPPMAKHQPARTITRRGQAAHEGDRPLPRRDQLPHARVGTPASRVEATVLGCPLARPARTPVLFDRGRRPARTPPLGSDMPGLYHTA